MLSAALKRWGDPRLSSVLLGGKGLWTKREQRILRRELRPFARRVVVISDLELSHRGAFGDGPGVLLIGGTGSAALGRDSRDSRGRWRRAGGWGPLLGDEGSAFWIGKRALKDPRLSRLWPDDLPLRVGRGKDPIRATASLARTVLSRASRGDAAARALRRRAAQALAALARDAAKDLPRPVPLVLHGGLFKDASLRRETLALLRGFQAQQPAMAPEQAGALIVG